MIDVKIVADSMAPSGVRLTTFVLTYPRFIHAEFMTHRMFSRNASSSRAIPVKKQIVEVLKNPVVPIAFLKNQKGMQGGEPIPNQDEARMAWLRGMHDAVRIAEKLSDMDVHKQYANRILEPWAHITVVCTATDFANFFALRCHSAAQPEIHELADKMYLVYQVSPPQQLKEGQYHIPFMDDKLDWVIGEDGLTNELIESEPLLQVKRSVARCARVSYMNHEGKRPTVEEDLKLYDRLVGAAPIHASPAEHQASASSDPNLRSGNFRGWVQYRKTLQNENVVNFTGPIEDKQSS